MDLISFHDKVLQFSSNVEIGKSLVSVEIDGLPGGVFSAMNLKSFIHGSPKGSAALLQFHRFDKWRIDSNNELTLKRIHDDLHENGFHSLRQIVTNHTTAMLKHDSLTQYWRERLLPELMHHSMRNGLHLDERFAATIARCNPVNSQKQLHPRATRFIDNHWPAIVMQHKNKAQGIQLSSVSGLEKK